MKDAHPSRRHALRQGATLAAAAAVWPGGAHAAGSDPIKVALVGCGGRGTGAAEQALTADAGARLVAMADAFADQIESSHSELMASAVAAKVEVPKERRFAGFDAYKQAIDLADVVLLTATPHFRPQHFAYAVEQGKPCFVEKPIAVDAPGVRSFLKSCDVAKEKGLSIASGLCWRASLPRREAIARARDGAFGRIVAVETTYNSGGVWDPRRQRSQVANEMEYQMRNWYYYRWLSGDHIVEQAIHGIDTMAWVLGDKPPQRCFGVGGRQQRVDPQYGNIFDHFSLVYEYDEGVRGYHQCRHWRETAQQTRDFVHCADGTLDVFRLRADGAKPWRHKGEANNMYQTEHDEWFASIRAKQPRADGHFTATSTLLAIMGRMAAYTGAAVTWDMAMNSQEVLGPKEYAWGDLPDAPIPVPGVTPFA